MKIFNIPFTQRQILRIPPHRRPSVNPLQYRLRTAAHPQLPKAPAEPSFEPLPVSRFPLHLSRNPRPSAPGVPFSAPPVLKPPPDRARCPISSSTCPGIPAQVHPVSHFPPHLSRKPLRIGPGVPFPAPPVPESPLNLAQCPVFRPTGRDYAIKVCPVSRLRHHRAVWMGKGVDR